MYLLWGGLLSSGDDSLALLIMTFSIQDKACHFIYKQLNSRFLITQTGSELVMKLQPNTSEQSTLRIKRGLHWDPNPSPSSPSTTHISPVLPLSKLPTRTSS